MKNFEFRCLSDIAIEQIRSGKIDMLKDNIYVAVVTKILKKKFNRGYCAVAKTIDDSPIEMFEIGELKNKQFVNKCFIADDIEFYPPCGAECLAILGYKKMEKAFLSIPIFWTTTTLNSFDNDFGRAALLNWDQGPNKIFNASHLL